MTEDELIEKLARVACKSEGWDPDKGGEVPSVIITPAGQRLTGVTVWDKKWECFEPDARRFLAMMKAYEEAKEQEDDEGDAEAMKNARDRLRAIAKALPKP